MDNRVRRFIIAFAYTPNLLGMCGAKSVAELFATYMTNGKGGKDIDEIIPTFGTMFPYLKTLMEIFGNSSPFDYRAVEAYWLGNDSLIKVKPEHFEILIRAFEAQGADPRFIASLRQNPPKKFIPTHLFHLLYFSTRNTHWSIEELNSCMIRWGTVISISKNGETANVRLNSLRLGKNGYELFYAQQQTVKIVPGFIRDLTVGDTVLVHWGQMTHKITPGKASSLTKWTQRVIMAVNKMNEDEEASSH